MDLFCRLCCSTKFVNNHIFDEENALHIKMSLYLPIKVIRGDRLPQRICDKCSCKVNDFYQFCNEVIEVQNKFKALLEGDDKEPDPSIDLTVIKRDTSSPIPQCERSTQTEEAVSVPNAEVKIEPVPASPSSIKEENSDVDHDYIPDLASFDSEDEVLSNIKLIKSSVNNELRTQENGTVKSQRRTRGKTKEKWEKMLPARLLMENDINVIKSDGQMNLDVVKHEAVEVKPQDLGINFDSFIEINQNAYYCCICFIQGESKPDMLKHYKGHVIKSELQSDVPDPPSMPDDRHCQRCQKTVVASSWGTHWRRHWTSDRRPYRCGLCEKTFRDHHQIFKHGQTHKAGEKRTSPASKRFVCDICTEGFFYMKCLLAHRTRAHPESAGRALQLRCSVCAREFAHLNSLRRHQRSHTGERNYLCNVCGKSLTSREHLKFHIRIHTGYKPHVCGTCGKGFVKKCNLTLHERVHSGEKPHVCSHCGKAFSQRSTLVIHERYHSGARPYSCELCGRGFVAKGLLSMHLKTACVDHPPPADKLSSRS